MKINIEKNLVEFTPETNQETKEIEAPIEGGAE